MTEYLVPQRGVAEAVAISTLRDHFEVKVVGTHDPLWIAARAERSRRNRQARAA